MEDDKPEGDAEVEEEDEEETRRLEESTLWKEDVFLHGHDSVWGSWYEPEAKRWGYSCCKSCQRDQPCPEAAARPAKASWPKEAPKEPGSDSGIEKDSETDSDENKSEMHPWAWKDFPTELQQPPTLKERTVLDKDWSLQDTYLLKNSKANYVIHFMLYTIGAWRKHQETGFQGFDALQKDQFKSSADAEKALGPLMWRLKRKENLDRGEKKKDGKVASRETRTSMESKHVQEMGVLDALFRMASYAAEKDYFEANAIYMKLAFGNKMWNLTFIAHVAACTMKGAREYRRNRDSLNTYDNDPVSQKYMHGFKKIVHLLQTMAPNEDTRKNFHL